MNEVRSKYLAEKQQCEALHVMLKTLENNVAEQARARG